MLHSHHLIHISSVQYYTFFVTKSVNIKSLIENEDIKYFPILHFSVRDDLSLTSENSGEII